MSRIAQTFQALQNRKALIPYITAGDPDLAATVQLMHGMADAGADILELGVPFSDPMADGEVIQRAVERALANKVSLRGVLAAVQEFRQNNQHTPVVLMGYLNPIHNMGYAAADAGVDGMLTVDSPIEHISPLQAALAARGIDCIFLIAPTTTPERIAAIAEKASGFIYYVSLKGVTGSARLDTEAVARQIALLRQYTDLPIGVGFGIRDAQSAAQIAQVADAVIVGSRIVQEIEKQPAQAVRAVADLVRELKAAV